MLANSRLPLAFSALALLSCAPHGKDLLVTAFSPRPSTDEAEPPIRLTFNRPVVDAAQVGQPLARPPVTVAPAFGFTAHWEDRQTLVLVPAGALRPSTKYEVSLAGELAGRVKETAFSFIHQPLAATGILGIDAARVPPEPRLTVRFNQPVKAGDAAARCSLRLPGSEEGLAVVTPDPAAEAADVVLAPKQALAQGEDYELHCEGLAGVGGNTGSLQPIALKLHTYSTFAVVAAGPRGREVSSDSVEIELRFATPMDLAAIQKAIKIDPAVPGVKKGWLDETRTHYVAQVDLAADQQYEVTLPAKVKDVYGQALAADWTWDFHTGEATPRLSLERGIFAVETAAPGYPVWSRNVDRFTIDCARVPKEKVVQLLTSDMNYDPWYGEEVKDIDWAKLGLSDRKSEIKTGDQKNRWTLAQVKLAEQCGSAANAGPKGLYLAELRTGEVKPRKKHEDDGSDRRSRVLANVTDLGVLLKAGPASGIIWVTGIPDGKPVAGAQVTLFTPQGKQVWAGATDANGLARLPGTAALLAGATPRDKDPFEENPEGSEGDWDSWRAQRMVAVVEKDGDMAVVDGNWANGIQIWNFGVQEDRQAGLTRIRGLIQSDRGIYRPGETVHFKGIVREIEVGKPPRLPKDKEIAVHVEDSRGGDVLDQKLPVSAFGGFAMDLPITSEAPLGDYYVSATLAGETFRERFQVEEFRKVEYEVSVAPFPVAGGDRVLRLGSEVRLGAQAMYLFGAPVAGAAVKWSVERREHEVSFARLPGFSFADDAARGDDYYWRDYRSSPLSFVSDGEGKTDKQGSFMFSFSDPEKDHTGPEDYLTHVTVTDDTNQSVSKQVVITAHPSDYYLGMHSEEFVQAVDMPFAVQTVAVTPDGTRVAAKATLSFIRRREVCTDPGGYRSFPDCKHEDQKIWSRAVDIPATGSGTERIMPKMPGEFIIRLEGQDARGNKVATSSWVWIIGKGEAFWSGDESDRMSVLPSKQSYNPGEKARLVTRTRLTGGTALVTLERNGIIDAFVQPLETSGQGIEIPIKEAFAPNVFASVAVVRGRVGEGDRNRPRFQMGVADLNVSAETQRLKVVVATDKPSYQPGDQISGSIRVTSRNEPVSAEVALSVADEGVLQLVAYKTPDPMKAFYAPWGLGIDSATTWNRISRLSDPTEGDPDEGGDGGDGRGPAVRSRFVSSAYWASSLVTDAKGEIRFKFQAPDNLTAFRLMAVAADSATRFGSGDSRFTLKKPLLLSPVLPRFLAEGDRLEVGVLVRNYTGAAGQAKVTAQASGLALDAAEKIVPLEKDGSAKVMFAGVVQPAAEAGVQFTVKMGADADGLRLPLPIVRPLSIDTASLTAGKLDGPKTIQLAWDKDVLASDSRLVVSVDRTGLSELEPGLRYLIEYPYGCLEQTLSRFIPLTKVKDLADSLGLKDLDGPKLQTFLKLGVAKVYRFQHEDGHFSLWQAGQTYPHLTVYAMYGLNEAKRAGLEVDKEVLIRGTAAMKTWANAADRVLGAKADGGTMAMAAYVLASMGQADAGLNARLYEARRGLPVYGQAFLLAAMKVAGAPVAQVTVLEAELLARVVFTGDVAEVREKDPDHELEHYMSSDARSTAITLSALLLVDPDNSVVGKLASGLKKQEKSGGRWSNTQENLFALVALADLARRGTAGSSTVTVSLDGKPLASKKLKGGEVLSLSRPLSALTAGKLSIESDGAAYASARMVLVRRDPGRVPVNGGFAVAREYLDPATGKPLAGFKSGQLVKVHLQIASPKDRRWVAVVDPLPAGFEAVNAKLATSQKQPGGDGDEGDDEYAPRLWTQTELHDDRLYAFADDFPDGKSDLEYLVRATTPGTFTAGPAHVEAMYEPDVYGRAPALQVKVEK